MPRRSASTIKVKRRGGIFRRFSGGERCNESDDASAHSGALDARKGLVEREAFIRGHEGLHGIDRAKGRIGRVAIGRGIGEQGADLNAENRRNGLQTGRADTIGALFILLDLLEGDAQSPGQRTLAHAERLAAHSDLCADMDVDRAG